MTALCLQATCRLNPKAATCCRTPKSHHGGRRENGIAHSVKKFLVGRNNGSQGAAQCDLFRFDEEIRTKPDATAHRLHFAVSLSQ